MKSSKKSSIKILYFADVHIRDNKPRYRKDVDFFSVQYTKLQEILSIYDKEKCDFVISGGDLFDSYDTSIRNMLSVIAMIKNKWSKKNFFSLLGNHDLAYENIDNYNNTAVGLLEAIDILDIPFDDIKIGDNIIIRFLHYKSNYKLDENDFVFDSAYDSMFKIIVNHFLITKGSVPFDHILSADVHKITNANLILCSHVHHQFRDVTDKCSIINPGTIVRGAVSEMNCAPGVLLLELGAKNNFKFVPLKSALPGNEVFDVEAKEEKDKTKKEFNEFFNMLKTMPVTRGDIIEELKAYISKIEDPDKVEIQNTIVTEIIRAREVLNA